MQKCFKIQMSITGFSAIKKREKGEKEKKLDEKRTSLRLVRVPLYNSSSCGEHFDLVLLDVYERRSYSPVMFSLAVHYVLKGS